MFGITYLLSSYFTSCHEEEQQKKPSEKNGKQTQRNKKFYQKNNDYYDLQFDQAITFRCFNHRNYPI